MGGGEVLKEFEIALDITRSISNREFSVVEGDTGNVLHILLTDDGEPVNLSGCRVLAIFSKSTGTSSQDSGAEDGGVCIGGAAGNEVTISLFNTSFAPGMVECELQIYSGAALKTLVTSAKFNFTCRRGILNDETVQSTGEYPLLVGLMAQAAVAVETADAAAAAAYAAAAATGQATHAARHAEGGADPISPASIGAAEENHTHGEYAAAGHTHTLSSLGAAAAPQTKELFLDTSGWESFGLTRWETVPGVTDESIIIITPAPASLKLWAEAVVRCIASNNGQLKFACDTVPADSVTANILIVG